MRVDDDDVRVDGRVTEDAWISVPVFPAFTQSTPRYGADPTHRTDVRLAYGERGLYLSFICYGDPNKVLGAVARKDQVPTSDRFEIFIDPNNDDTNGYMFQINASGAQSDAQIFRDDGRERLWDGVWQGAAKKIDEGWSGEMFIPWSTLRFERRDSYTFGIVVSRFSTEGAEWSTLNPKPQGLPGLLSWATDYGPVEGITPGLNLELRPYWSSRLAIRRPPGSLDMSPEVLPNVGLEAKYGLTGNLTMDIAINPDFGQAEVDPAVLNLGPFEVFFPERRQFFLESKEIFETPFRLFYSRRVGNNPRASRADTTSRPVQDPDAAPDQEPPDEEDVALEEGELASIDPMTRILEAVRVTGEAVSGWRTGLFTATTGPTFGEERFSDGKRRPVDVDPVTQFTVARVRRQFDGQTHVGGMVTSVIRADDEPDAWTGGVDYAIRFLRRWRHRAQVIGTHDGEKTGMGGNGDISRSSKNTNWNARWNMLTPNANFNDAGFMRNANFINGETRFSGFNAQPVGRLRRLSGSATLAVESTFAGQLTKKLLFTETNLETLGLWRFRYNVGGQLPRLDIFETRGGIPWEVPLHWFTGFDVETPYNRKFVARLNAAYGEQGGKPGPDLGLNLNVRPADRFQLGLRGSLRSSFGRPRWVQNDDEGEAVFGAADLISTEITARFTLGITPQLSVQSFNQLLYSTAHHDEFFLLEDPQTLVPTDPVPYQGEVDQGLTALTSNSILRWEYLPGSFLFFVYTHRSSLGENGLVEYSPGAAFTNLAVPDTQSEDTVFIKMVHLFGL